MKSIKNIQQITNRRSFPDFMTAMNYKVDLKEWSEVGGVYNICRTLLKTFNPDIIFDIGCGKRPTLGVIMALNYKIPVYCIDPQLDTELAKNINDIFLKNISLQEYNKILRRRGKSEDKALILGNHSHVSKQEITEFTRFFSEWVYITVPCCIDNKLTNRACVCYKDIHMHSPKNNVFICASNNEYLKGLL